ncbi:putative odorant receptor 85e [Halyomorpha halys]|uniref:putative odorant receptor 85e n=1 Tax=Halyomorpha halys TaxID=286706 RepID=UPI0006D50A5F|nr:odorant receptor 82a-like [Halyomorpha halys]KAE8573133.1 Odorant receptor 73 [Halyomorpha halys]
MKEVDIDSRYFRAIGLWQFVVDYKATYWVLFNFALASVFFVNISVQLMNTLTGGYEFSLLTEKLSVNLTVMESVIKIIYYCAKRRKLYSLSLCFRRDFLICRNHDREVADEVLNTGFSSVNTVTKGFVVMIFTTVGLWNSFPFLRCLTGDCSKWNIMPSWYPEAMDGLPAFIYIFEFFIMVFCAALLYNVNCFFSALALSLSSQFQLLTKSFSSIETNAERRKGCKIYNMNVLLRECLIDHQRLLRLVKEMEDMYNPIFLFQMLTSTFTICLVLVQLNDRTSSKGEMPVAMVCKFFMYLMFGSMELLVYSWGGQIIYDQTGEVHRSLYESGWASASHYFRKSVLIAQIRTLRPEYLTAGKFYAVDLASFTQIIKASYSYFTFLHGSGGSSR